MRKFLTIEDTIANKITYYHLLLFLVSLPFDRFYSQLVLISLLLHTIIHFRKSAIRAFSLKKLLILQSIFWLTAIGILYSKNLGHANSMLSRQLAILLFPLIFFINNLDLKKYITQLFTVFSLTCTVVVLYLYIDAFRIISFNRLPIDTITSAIFLNHNFSSPIGIHATYLSLYIALCLTFITTCLFSQRLPVSRIIILTGYFILWLGLIQLGARTVLITTVLINGFVFPIFCLRGQQQKRFLFLSAAILLTIGICLLQIQSLRTRFLEDLLVDLGGISKSHGIGEPRIERWKLALEIIKESPFFGYGSGEELDLLKDSYFKNKLFNSYLFSLNAHNQYLSVLIKHGITGLLIYLGTLGYGLILALKTKDIMLLSFLLLLIMLSFSENFLDVNKGIFFYAFFFALFIKAS